jgi:predicted transglutaminase-like protease
MVIRSKNMDMNTIIKGVVLSKVCSIKADGESTESKNINLVVSFDGVALQGVFDKAVSSTVISWQNGVGRKHFTSYVNNQIVKIDFKSPGKTQVDVESAMKARLKAMTPEEREAKIAEMMAECE